MSAMHNVAIVDTETTGLSPQEGDKLVQLAALTNHNPDAGYPKVLDDAFSVLINPHRSIPPEACAVHHITEEMAASQGIEAEEAINRCQAFLQANEIKALVAHNAPFDRSFLPEFEGYLWIDTLRWARHSYPSAPSHSNQVMRYYLKLNIHLGHLAPHDALADVIVTQGLFNTLYRKHLAEGGEDSLEAIAEAVNAPLSVEVFPFGKHKGRPTKEVVANDFGYVAWALTSIHDMDADLQATLVGLLDDKQRNHISGKANAIKEAVQLRETLARFT